MARIFPWKYDMIVTSWKWFQIDLEYIVTSFVLDDDGGVFLTKIWFAFANLQRSW